MKSSLLRNSSPASPDGSDIDVFNDDVDRSLLAEDPLQAQQQE